MNTLFVARATVIETPYIAFDPIIDPNLPQLITAENVIEDLTVSHDQTQDILNSKVFSLSASSVFCGSAMSCAGSGVSMFIMDPERGRSF